MNAEFAILRNLNADQLRSIPKDQIIKSIEAALDDEDDTCSVFEFAFTQLPNILSFSETNELICQRMVPMLKNMFDEAITHIVRELDHCKSTDTELLVDQIQTIFQLFAQLLQSINEKLNEMLAYFISDIDILLLNLLNFVCKSTSLDLLYSRDDIKQYLNIMQTSIKQMLTSPKLHIKSTTEELTICRDVLLGLIELGRQQAHKNDVKSMADTWKQLSKLAIDFRRVHESHECQEQMEIDEHRENILDWIELFIQTICELITANVQKVFDAIKCPKETIAVTKLTAFYLKLMENLAKEYTHDQFRGQSHLIEMYEMIADKSNQYEDAGINSYLSMLQDGCMNVLLNVFNCDRFSGELFLKFRGNHIRTCIAIIVLLLRSSTTSNDWYLNVSDPNHNILHHLLFVCIPKEMIQIYRSEDLYDKIVNLCTTLLLESLKDQETNDSMEQTMIEVTLIDNPYRMPILMDIWILFFRHLTNESLMMYCKMWIKLRQNASLIVRNPSTILVQELLKYTFNLLPVTYQSQIFRLLSHNNRFIMEQLGLESSINRDLQPHTNVGQNIVEKVKHIFEKRHSNCEIVSPDKCIEVMSALTCFQLPISQHQQLVCDRQFVDDLADALIVLKTKQIEVLHVYVLRVMLWQEYFCKNDSVRIDYSESRKILATELIGLAQLVPNCANKVTISVLGSMMDLDSVIQARAQKTTGTLKQIYRNGVTSCSTIDQEYFYHILNTKHNFGCMSIESCLNRNAKFKHSFDRIIQEIKMLENASKDSLHADWSQFSREIAYICDYFNRLQN